METRNEGEQECLQRDAAKDSRDAGATPETAAADSIRQVTGDNGG
jgi:hypothetical protein